MVFTFCYDIVGRVLLENPNADQMTGWQQEVEVELNTFIPEQTNSVAESEIHKSKLEKNKNQNTDKSRKD